MSDLALRLIAENRKTKAIFLDLGNCALTAIPAEISELTWLESLSLTGIWHEWDGKTWQERKSLNTGDKNDRFTTITVLAGLTELRSLILASTQTADLAPLAGLHKLQTLYLHDSTITDIAPLSKLTALRTLILFGKNVTDISPLANLPVLQTLDISGALTTDLAPLSGLISLQTLHIERTRVTDLTPLAGLTTLQTLNIASTQITDLASLKGLYNLQILNLRETRVADLSPLSGLADLQLLNLRGTGVTDLAPLANLVALQALNLRATKIANLVPLSRLVTLRTLNISDTRIIDLAPLACLTTLQHLDIWHTRVVDLTPLTCLTSLQTLDISDTRVADLMPLKNMAALQTLSAGKTLVADLAPLANLTALQALDISHTPVHSIGVIAKQLALRRLNIAGTIVADLAPLRNVLTQDFPILWRSFGAEQGIYVEDCPLVNPPVEIVKQGSDAILNYFREREEDDVDNLYEAKMLILGEGGAGKTSLLRRLYQTEKGLPTEQETTRGIDIHRHDFLLKNGRRFRLNVWDFGGQEIYHATHQFFLTRRSLYLLLDDTRKDHKSVSDAGFKYWLELIDLFGDHSPVLIFQNEKGGRSKSIDFVGIKGRYDNVKELYAGNLEHLGVVDKLREGIEFYASNLCHIGEQLPARWIKVRADIESRAAESPYITQQEYFDIYRRHLVFDRAKALHLSRYLHDLGVFLHFQDDPLLSRTVILQNPWCTEAVFRILDDEIVKSHLGRFADADCERLWQDSQYADMQPELLALMKRFELCYQLADTRPPISLAPQLLPPAKPTALYNWGKPEDMVLRYRYDFMPKGIINRLMVRLHRFVRAPEMAWVTGVLFERDNTKVLVESLPSGSEIELRARGPERKALLSVVAADLDALNESFPGLRDKVDKRIPCNCKSCSFSPVPEFFAYKELLRRKEHNRMSVECPRSFESVDVSELIDGIRLDDLPDWATNRKDRLNEISAPRITRIFLASSSELREDRDAFDLYFRQQNDRFLKKGLYLEIVRWENFLDTVSDTRLQDEYNRAVRECDVFVSLFFTKTGKFSEEEFDTAHSQFKETGRPLIYTYFKNADFKTGSTRKEDLISMLAFQEKLAKLGHFYTSYDNVEHLKRQFRDQLDKINPLLQRPSDFQND